MSKSYGDIVTEVAKEHNQTCYRYLYALKHLFIVECWYAKFEQMPTDRYNAVSLGKTIHIVNKTIENNPTISPLRVNFEEPENDEVVLVKRNDELAKKLLHQYLYEEMATLQKNATYLLNIDHAITFQDYCKEDNA